MIIVKVSFFKKFYFRGTCKIEFDAISKALIITDTNNGDCVIGVFPKFKYVIVDYNKTI